ncbi:MAG: hypothetical protein KDB27_21695 [Planctomycetales bacterium]|nr:hypothetical protein [Planctomycetales bacterium]
MKLLDQQLFDLCKVGDEMRLTMKTKTALWIVGLTVAFSASTSFAIDRMYWSDRGQNTIMRADLDGTNPEVLVDGLSEARGVAVDYENGMLYWADNGTNEIQRSMLDGSNVQTIVSNNTLPTEQQLSFPAGVALDVPAGKVYWADATKGHIQRANLDGSNVEIFVEMDQDAPYFVTADLENQHLYWTDQGSGKLNRIDLDGQNLVTLVENLPLPRGVDIDLLGGKLYWADRTNDVVQRSDLDGKNIETLFEATPTRAAPHGVAVDSRRGHVYWVDNGLVTLNRMDLDGANPMIIYSSDSGLLERPWQITLDLRNGTCRWDATSCDVTSQAERIDALAQAIRDGSNDSQFDLNRDSVVDASDRKFLVEYLLSTVPGDSNLDGYFTSNDFVTAFAEGAYEIDVDKVTWQGGDWNGDGKFTSTDLVVAFQSGRYEENQPAPVAVPEPSGAIPFALIVLACYTPRSVRKPALAR